MTHPEDSTATIERDLRAVDAALAAGAASNADPLVRELEELALTLRADAPEADAAFAAELGERARAGFPPEPGSGRARAAAARSSLRDASRRLPSPRRLLPAAAGLATVAAIVIGLASVDLNRTDDDAGDGGGGGGASVAESGGGEPVAPPGASRSAQNQVGPATAVPPSEPGGGFAPGRQDRKIERSISMTLEAPDDEIPALAEGVTQVTNRHGGFVLSSTLNSDDEGASGYFELRIPAGRLRAALADLAGLATVRSQSQSGQDVTRRHATARDRLDSARAERRSLLRRLELAATDEEAEALRRRLDIVAGEINGLRAQLRDLRLRTDYAVVTVDLAGSDGDSGAGGAGGSFDDAVNDAGDLFVGFAGVLIRILAIALPLGLIAAIGWLAASTLRRRRRESALA
jgi:Domain of unknown function (DUF4349)